LTFPKGRVAETHEQSREEKHGVAVPVKEKEGTSSRASVSDRERRHLRVSDHTLLRPIEAARTLAVRLEGITSTAEHAEMNHPLEIVPILQSAGQERIQISG
jgi:hypothetical protein